MKKNNIRYWISKVSIYIFIYCALFLIQRALLCTLYDIKKYVIFNKLYKNSRSLLFQRQDGYFYVMSISYKQKEPWKIIPRLNL